MISLSSARSQFRIFTLTLVVMLFSCAAFALPPEIKWRQIKTAHFTVVFDSKHYDLAARYAVFAEQAWASTSPVFGIWPENTVILIDDTTDLANGWATGVPYPMISTFPVLPSSLDSIGDYGNWGLELLTHEYVHVLNFEPATGLMKPLRWIFGSIVRPNILLPKWYSEGLAVEMETRLSSFGRLRSPNYLSIVRAMVEENTLRTEDISRINEVSIPEWPGGIRPYLMGALMWNELVKEGSDKIIGELNLAYSRRIPFLLNGPVEDRLKKNYTSILGIVYDNAESQAEKQILAIAQAHQPEEKTLKQSGFYFNHTPVISPDGKKLAYIGKAHNVDNLIFVADRGSDGGFVNSEAKRVREADSITRISWFPDSKSFVYDSVEVFNRNYLYSDLYRFNLDTKKTKRLTRGLRAREAVVSPGGGWIVFIQNIPGGTQLMIAKADGSGVNKLYTPPLQTRLTRPEFLSANEIVFTEKRDDGAEVLKRVRIKTVNNTVVLNGEPQTIFAELSPVHFPRMTAEGLLFVSDRSGAANLFLADKKLASAKAVTNTSTRVMTGELDAVTGDLFYSRLTSTGPQIFSSPRASWSKSQTLPPQINPLVETEWPKWTEPKVEVDTKDESYSAWPYMLPRYWTPYAYLVPSGLYFEGSTSANDPTNQHMYQLSASFDTLTQKPGFYGAYSNNQTPLTLSLAGANYYDWLYSFDVSRRLAMVDGSANFYLPKLSNSWRGTLGWNYSLTEVANSEFERNGVRVGLRYSNASRSGFEISPESGGSIGVSYTKYLPEMSDLDYDQTQLSFAKYLSGWILPNRHVIAISGNASYAPKLNRSVFGQTTIGGNYQASAVQSGYLMRGYDSGVFIGRNMLQGTLEYRFPLSYNYRGFGTTPFFIQKWHAAIFGDVLTLDGLAYDFQIENFRNVKLGHMYYGTGIEARADATVFYHLSMQFIFGLYYGLDKTVNTTGLFPFVGIGL